MAAIAMIVDPDEAHAGNLQQRLLEEGYDARSVFSAADALSLASTTPLGLIVLELALPDLPGVELCRRLKAAEPSADAPILVLSERSGEADRVAAFEAGADDFLSKPYSLRELMLRMRALLRRARPTQTLSIRRVGALRLDADNHRVWVEAREVSLTLLEFKLLLLLLDRRGTVQSRERILEDVWHMPGELGTRTVDTHVKRLRRKLGVAGDYIETVRGVGYRLMSRDEVPS